MNDSTPRDRALALLNEALTTGIRGYNRDAVIAAIEVLEDNSKSLSDMHYRNLAVGKTLRDPQRPGLWMRRNKDSGGKISGVWIFKCKQGSHTFGEYPAMALTEARERWDVMRKEAKEDRDPAAKPVTVKDLCGRFIEEYAMQNKRSWREDRRMFDYDFIPVLGEKDVLSVTRDDIEEVLEDIIDRGSPRSAEKLLTVVRKMFNHVLEQPKRKRWVPDLEHNPCTHIKLRKRETISVHLTDAQTRKFLRALPKVELPQAFKDIMLLQFMTVSRITEVTGMTWGEIDFRNGVWELPAARSKNKLSHRIMLSRQSIALLERIKADSDTDYVFPKKRSAGHVPGSLVARYMRDKREELGVPDGASTHSLRHSAMTQLASMGCGKELRDRISNHRSRSADAIYQHYEHDSEAGVWWQKWADQMDLLAAD